MNYAEITNSTIDMVSGLVGHIGRSKFDHQVYDFFNLLAPIDHVTAFTIPPGSAPKPLIAQGGSQSSSRLAQELSECYVSGSFTEDLCLSTLQEKCIALDFPNLQHITPSSIPISQYKKVFYDEPAITNEVSFVKTIDETAYYVSLYRTKQPAFNKMEMSAINLYAELAINIMRQHHMYKMAQGLEDTSPKILSPEERGHLLSEIREDLEASGDLSPREADVCAHIILGYSNIAISLRLGISINTAATHRKRSYAKLGISSQSELFTRYLHFARSRLN
ncbi:regulatory protein, luxR family [Pseudomonas cedrina]|uniref:HTH luxR-type domain-containing protein n=2 Tax=Pseudomonas cedrina TaxID=651740 RepID=A0A1V2JY54_PSECE|nr:LuxR C-terminal-related transcriptional regulator [Pseudomonas cedrina]ONH49551.1 hypothetical protein BLL36_29035 [Pseudomonas cedrina subsp. cedrina]SDT08785.1 regulatory protein, luxR family [Pseudomonas cedrina]